MTRPQGLGCDIGAYEAEVVEIGDHVWDDADGDGVQGADESGIAGVTLEVSSGGGKAQSTATTDESGAYKLVVTPGDWTVSVTDEAGLLSGRRSTTPSSLTLPVTVGGAVASNYDFGYGPSGAEGGAINVNTLGAAARDGLCSLAEALEAAEIDRAVDGCLAGSGDDEINISVPGVIGAPGSGFQVESNVTVQGNSGGTTVNAGGGVDVVVTKSGSANAATVTAVTLADLAITGARGSGVDVVDHGGAALTAEYVVSLENLRIGESTVSDRRQFGRHPCRRL